MSVFRRHIEATLVALNWKRTVWIERGVWEHRSTPWKPHADNIRNLRTIHSNEPDIRGWPGGRGYRGGPDQSRSYEVLSEHTHFEYEELNWHKDRLFTAKGDTPADLHWPEYALEPNQQVCERRESYRATFSSADGGAFTKELDEATWRTLKVGRKYRLEVGAFNDEVKQISLAGTSYSYRGK